MNKKQLEQKILELEQEVVNAQRYCRGYKQKIADILGNRLNQKNYLEWENVFDAISEMNGKLITQGQLLPIMEDHLKQENAKLWHMIRVAMRDEKRDDIDRYRSISRRKYDKRT